MQMFDVTDIYGKIHYFIPEKIEVISATEIKYDNEFGVKQKIECYEIHFNCGASIFISEEARQSFMSPGFTPPIEEGENRNGKQENTN